MMTAKQVDDFLESVRSLAASVETLRRTQAESVAVEQRLLKTRRWTWGILVVLAVGLGLTTARLQSSEHRSSCEAVNKTNEALLSLLDAATAASPTKAPEGSSSAEIRAFNAQLVRSHAFLIQTHQDLAPRHC